MNNTIHRIHCSLYVISEQKGREERKRERWSYSDERYDEKQRIKGQSGGRKGRCYFTKVVGKIL